MDKLDKFGFNITDFTYLLASVKLSMHLLEKAEKQGQGDPRLPEHMRALKNLLMKLVDGDESLYHHIAEFSVEEIEEEMRKIHPNLH